MASTAFGLLSPQTPVRARTLSQLQAPIPSIDIKCVLPLSPIGLVAGNEHCFKAQTHAEPAFGQCDHSTNRSRDKPQGNEAFYNFPYSNLCDLIWRWMWMYVNGLWNAKGWMCLAIGHLLLTLFKCGCCVVWALILVARQLSNHPLSGWFFDLSAFLLQSFYPSYILLFVFQATWSSPNNWMVFAPAVSFYGKQPRDAYYRFDLWSSGQVGHHFESCLIYNWGSYLCLVWIHPSNIHPSNIRSIPQSTISNWLSVNAPSCIPQFFLLHHSFIPTQSRRYYKNIHTIHKLPSILDLLAFNTPHPDTKYQVQVYPLLCTCANPLYWVQTFSTLIAIYN